MSETGFTGFPQEGLGFLRELALNNDRMWFQAHRDRYEEAVLGPLRELVAALVTRFAAARVPLTADPSRAVFRIHRDVRFSRDKQPYKTHAGAVLSRDGGKASPGVLYLHVDPAGSFVASGFYQPAPPALAALRGAIMERPRPFLAALRRLEAAGLGLARENALTRLPRGFEQAAGSPVADLLRLRGFVATQPVAAPALGRVDLVDTIDDFAAACLPLLRFGWAALA